jgi:predicted aspartyl protease
MLKSLLLYISILIFVSCGNKNDSQRIVVQNSIPDTIIPFEYTKSKEIILSAYLNDSIPIKLKFDTGAGSLLLDDSLKNIIGSNDADSSKVNVRIGNYTSTMPIYFYDNSFTKIQGIISWKIFMNKIIRISYSDKYIQIIDSFPNSENYDKIKLKVVNGWILRLPVKIHLQGKVIVEDLILDTGLNNHVCLQSRLINKYGLNTDSAEVFNGKTISGEAEFFSIKNDSIGISENSYYPVNKLYFIKKMQLYTGVLGNHYLENFDIILDLKNFILYLKPSNKYNLQPIHVY